MQFLCQRFHHIPRNGVFMFASSFYHTFLVVVLLLFFFSLVFNIVVGVKFYHGVFCAYVVNATIIYFTCFYLNWLQSNGLGALGTHFFPLFHEACLITVWRLISYMLFNMITHVWIFFVVFVFPVDWAQQNFARKYPYFTLWILANNSWLKQIWFWQFMFLPYLFWLYSFLPSWPIYIEST